MKIEDIKNQMRGKAYGTLGIMREFAILILLTEKEDGLHFVFEKRAGGIKQPGDVCFPGGKVEPGETREAALVRELREELAIDARIEKFVGTVEYDYPKFHLTMHTFLCTIADGELTLQEHLAARWIFRQELASIDWLPADREIATSLAEQS